MQLTTLRKGCNNYHMEKREWGSDMTSMLRQALSEADSLQAIERATGVKRQSMMRFLRGDQSLRLDLADKLASHFGITCIRRNRETG